MSYLKLGMGRLLVYSSLCVFLASRAMLVATYFRFCQFQTFTYQQSVIKDCGLRGYEGDMTFEMLGTFTQQCTILPPRDYNLQLHHSEHLIICLNQWYYHLFVGTHVTHAMKWKHQQSNLCWRLLYDGLIGKCMYSVTHALILRWFILLCYKQ